MFATSAVPVKDSVNFFFTLTFFFYLERSIYCMPT